ncbi:HesB/YadR/YfhF-family protein [Alicyclobacillus hesperidum URH17-3-68]|nr:HesB/YadR/YfhF-family protein [Alicyclobacillus hesperidum URH17-3-68]
MKQTLWSATIKVSPEGGYNAAFIALDQAVGWFFCSWGLQRSAKDSPRIVNMPFSSQQGIPPQAGVDVS